MPENKSTIAKGQIAADLLIIGGGIMGLWVAVKAVKSAMSVILIDASSIGSGASGSVLGALFPWMPERWDHKKQFQLRALTSLGGEIASLEMATGQRAHYRQCGRLIGLPQPHLREISLGLQRDALAHWRVDNQQFYWHVIDKTPFDGWPADEIGQFGLAYDTLAARVAPRALIGLLKTWLAHQPNIRLIEHCALRSLEPERGIAATTIGDIGFGHAVIATGVESFPVIEKLLPIATKPLGQAVKGQAALLKADIDPAMPVIFLDGLYIVAHEGGHVAIGSTSETIFDAPLSTDLQLEDLIARARQIVPRLENAEVIERWAGLRPKAIGRDPMVGPLPGHDNISAMTGGFKISFGIAHALADCVVDFIKGDEPDGLPQNFRVESHVSRSQPLDNTFPCR